MYCLLSPSSPTCRWQDKHQIYILRVHLALKNQRPLLFRLLLALCQAQFITALRHFLFHFYIKLVFCFQCSICLQTGTGYQQTFNLPLCILSSLHLFCFAFKVRPPPSSGPVTEAPGGMESNSTENSTEVTAGTTGKACSDNYQFTQSVSVESILPSAWPFTQYGMQSASFHEGPFGMTFNLKLI